MQYYFYILTANDDPDNVRYVGVTTRTIKQRMHGHKYNAKHAHKRVQPVHKWIWSKMEKNIEISITQIDECEKSEWENREKYWVKHYRDLGFDLLNVSEGGAGVITKEMRDKSGIQRSIEAHKKPVCCINPKTKELVAIYNSVTEATEAMGLRSKSAIGNALSSITDTILSAGYYWVYKDDYDSGNYILKEINEHAHVKTPVVYRFDLNGNLLDSYFGVKAAAKGAGALSGNTSALNIALKNKTIYSGCYWSFNKVINVEEFENQYKYMEIDSNGIEVCKYRNQTEISKKYNLSTSHVCINIQMGRFFGENKIIKI